MSRRKLEGQGSTKALNPPGHVGVDDSDSDDEEARELKHAIKAKRAAADEEAARAQELQKRSEAEAVWIKITAEEVPYLYTMAFVPFLMALISVVVGSIIANSTDLSACVARLDVFISGNIVLGYIYLMAYGMMHLGLGGNHCRNLKALKILAGIFVLFGFVWHILGTAFYAKSGPCADTTPTLRRFCGFQVISFWVAVICVGLSFAFQHWRRTTAGSRKAASAQAERVRQMAEEDAKEEEEARAALKAQKAAGEDDEEEEEEEEEEEHDEEEDESHAENESHAEGGEADADEEEEEEEEHSEDEQPQESKAQATKFRRKLGKK